MSANDRHANEETGSGSSLPVEDLSPRDLDAQSDEQVKGGADATSGKVATSEIVVTKQTDVASPTLFR